jgi:hypothetical protein
MPNQRALNFVLDSIGQAKVLLSKGWNWADPENTAV